MDEKICIGCGNVFYKKDIPSHVLKRHPFEFFKRCPECRKRTDIRPPDYHKNYRRSKKKSLLYRVSEIDRLIAKIAIMAAKDVIPIEEQNELDQLLLSGRITKAEKKRLKNHYEGVLFLYFGNMQIPHYTKYDIFTTLNKEVMRIFYPYFTDWKRNSSQLPEEQH